MQVLSVPWLVEKAQDPLTCAGQVLEGKFSYSMVRHVVQQVVPARLASLGCINGSLFLWLLFGFGQWKALVDLPIS